mgnify:CR=1 FL=1
MKIGNIERGNVVIVNFEPVRGSEQGGIRPAVIVQNDISNKYSSTTIIVPFTSKKQTKTYVTNVPILAGESGLKKDSLILCNQIKTIDKSRIIKKIGNLDRDIMKQVDMAIKVSLDLN